MKNEKKINPDEINEEQQAKQENSDENQADEQAQRIEQLEKEVNEYKDRLLRKAAEFENYKRRTENDQLNLFKYAAEGFIVKFLPVIDDFERSLAHIDSARDINSVKEGIKLVYDKLMKIFDEQGIKKIDAVGKPFDVNFHEAVMQRKAENAEPHTVLDELEKGYLYKDRVIRHSKVIVSEDSTEEAASTDLNNDSSSSEGEQ